MWAAGSLPTVADLTGLRRITAPEPTYLREFFDSSHDLIMHLSGDNNFLFVNKSGQEKLGYTEAELMGRPLTDVVHPYYRAKLLYQLRRLYEGQALNKLETVLLTSAGRPVHLIGSVSSEQLPGQAPSARAVLHDITDRIKAERLQKVYYSIANLAISAHDLPALYGAIHRELSKVIETNNIFIALCDDERTELNFVYYVDQHAYFEQGGGRPFSMGVTEYVIQQGQPLFFTQADLVRLMRNGELTAFGRLPAVLLASPLSVGDRTIGVLTVQEYDRADLYTPADLDILHFISSQVALAIDRKGKEEHLTRQNARLSAIFESGAHLMWSVDRSGVLISFNRNYAAFYLRRNGVAPTQGLNLLETEQTLDNNEVRQVMYTHYVAAGKGQSQKFEVNLRDPQGRDLWLSITFDPIYLPNGSFEEIAAQAQDITASKNSQLILAAQEEKFRSIFESFQDVYYRTDEEGCFTILSPSVREVLGYDPGAELGRPAENYYWEPTGHADVLDELERTGELRNFETQMRHRAGYPVNVLINARRTPSGTEGIARDVTEIRRIQDDLRLAMEEAEAASAAKTQFLANMSHELRTPMNGIIGMIDLLGQTGLSSEQTDYVDTLRTSSDALLTILNDILDLSKIQAGKMRLNEAPLALAPLLDRVHSLFSYRASQKSLRFTCHLAPDTPPVIATDEMRLLQILSNLAANAIKFTSHGTVSVVVSLVSTENDFNTLRFAVQDSGIGISPDDAARLFTSFTQLDTTPSKAYGGTGLGLAISKELAELLGGTIGVVSDVGEGSVFWFTIRCRVSSALAMPVVPVEELPPPTPPAQQEAYVLLVDDNVINQKVAARLLAKLGCQVDIASDGYEAIARATAPNAPYQLILMDIQMPGLDGIEATRAIRAQLGAASPPIVAMTAYSMPDDAARFVQAGLDDYLAKPVKHQQLAQTLARWVAAAPPPSPEEPTTAVADQLPMLDPEVLAQLHQLGGAEFTAELYAEFAQEAADLLQQVKTHSQAEDAASLRPLLHQLKGTAATLGLTALATQAQTLEHNIKNGKTSGLTVEFNRLHQYFAYFLAHYAEQVTLAQPTANS
ncbi:PAS domain S-box protein [Hymenobacter sp. HMF4947]|uniref:histidine kinase n=2 Tax=Hymenobacter ginkgonis TaxID=2682976 RepID=A0A7K1TA29_9BACT|nr:PAS domain S-box protein [Hymenobacter ginkgonis]